jgi:peptide/nickel transport system substrate-binding protein
LRQGNPSGFWSDDYAALRTAMEAAGTREELEAATKALSDYMLDQAFTLDLVQAPGQIVVSSQLEGVEISVRGGMIFRNAHLAN